MISINKGTAGLGNLNFDMVVTAIETGIKVSIVS
jgi:hypothetical protein